MIVAVYGCGDGSTGTAGAGGRGGNAGVGGAAPLMDEYVLEDQDLVPESGAFDPVTRSFFVGSETAGSITQVQADGTESIFFEPPANEAWRTLGVAIDMEARRLWVCADGGDLGQQEIWVFDLSSGEQTVTLDLATAAAGSTCNDIALDSDGLAYISDSSNPRIYRANAVAEEIEAWADDPVLGGDGPIFGGNGIAVTDDDAFILLSKTLAPAVTPRLLRVDRNDPTHIIAITTTPEPLTGAADGMSLLDGDLYIAIVGTGEIVRLATSDDWSSASISSTMAVAGTSTVRPAEGALYAIYSDITASLLGNPVSPPFRIFRVDLASFQ